MGSFYSIISRLGYACDYNLKQNIWNTLWKSRKNAQG